jgi:hypothetical protein
LGGEKNSVPDVSFYVLIFSSVVPTCSAKPAFFMDCNRAPLFEVDTKSGMLLNTDHGNPLAQIGGVDTATQVLLTKTTGQTNQVFQASIRKTKVEPYSCSLCWFLHGSKEV